MMHRLPRVWAEKITGLWAPRGVEMVPCSGGLSWEVGGQEREVLLAALTVPGWEKGLEQSRAGKKASWPYSFTPWYQYCVAEEPGLDPGLSLAKWMALGT